MLVYPARRHEAAICERIAQAREAAGLTREGLAQHLSAWAGTRLTERDVRAFERTRVPWSLLDDVARLTGTSTGWLLYGRAEGAPPAAAGRAEAPALGTEAAAGRDSRRPTRARVALGLALGVLVGLVAQAAAHSRLAALAGLLVAAAIVLRTPARP